jgi:hypothetical protein
MIAFPELNLRRQARAEANMKSSAFETKTPG